MIIKMITNYPLHLFTWETRITLQHKNLNKSVNCFMTVLSIKKK